MSTRTVCVGVKGGRNKLTYGRIELTGGLNSREDWTHGRIEAIAIAIEAIAIDIDIAVIQIYGILNSIHNQDR